MVVDGLIDRDILLEGSRFEKESLRFDSFIHSFNHFVSSHTYSTVCRRHYAASKFCHFRTLIKKSFSNSLPFLDANANFLVLSMPLNIQ